MEVNNITAKNQLNNLALFRVLLCCGVFIYHAYYNMSCNFGILNNFSKSAVYYMTGFFMLSGLVVGFSNSNLNASNWDEIKAFYRKRIRTVFPLYFLVFAFGILLFVRSFHDLFMLIIALPFQLLGIANIVQNEYFYNSGTWFFTNILLCYLIFPYINFVLSKLNTKKLKSVTVLLLLLLADSKLVEVHLTGAGIYRNPIIRIVEFSVGICLARLYINSKYKIKMGGFLSVIAFIINIFAIFVTENRSTQAVIAAPLAFITMWILIRTDNPLIKGINANIVINSLQKYTLEFWVATFFTTEIVNRLLYPTFLPAIHINIYRIVCCCSINIIIAILLHIYQYTLLHKIFVRK